MPPAAYFLSAATKSFHRRVSRFPATLWHGKRDTSSKPPCCIRHRRRFGGFLKTPLETLGFKTSSFADKSCRLNPAKAGNWRISIIAAAALGDGRGLLFYRRDVPPAGNFLPIAAERFTVVSASFQPRCGMETGTLPRDHLASSATGGASAISD